MQHTNIEHAIVAVKERGHELTVPNVLAAYIQCITAHIPPEDITQEDKFAQTVITSFERAMDKYPALSPLRLSGEPSTLAKTATASVAPGQMGSELLDKQMFCAEVTRLRGEYLWALRRAADVDAGSSGCRCISCGTLLKMRSSEVRKLEDGEGEEEATVARPVRKRRAGKMNSKKARAAKKVPFDPYAPSTSRATI
ncbi:hypothetical protein C2E23DRAFT_870613 [Lenzites betulinus]|nr:hypothetical protein C2E23DRAFT_870613 [Lenzites betulinus]